MWKKNTGNSSEVNALLINWPDKILIHGQLARHYCTKLYIQRYLYMYLYMLRLSTMCSAPFIGSESVFRATILARCWRYIRKVAASHEFVSDRPIRRLTIYSKYPATIIKFVLNDRYGYHLATISSRCTNGIGAVRGLREATGPWSGNCVFASFPLSGSRICAELRSRISCARSYRNIVSRQLRITK